MISACQVLFSNDASSDLHQKWTSLLIDGQPAGWSGEETFGHGTCPTTAKPAPRDRDRRGVGLRQNPSDPQDGSAPTR